MSRYGAGSSHRDLTDTLQDLLMTVGKVLLYGGLLAAICSSGLLVYTFQVFTGESAANQAQALSNIELYRKILVAGLIAYGVGGTYLMWGEETLAIFQLMIAGLLYFAPLYLPPLFGVGENLPNVASQALVGLQSAGGTFGILAIGVLLADVSNRIRLRILQGVRVEQLKYGKGVREERDRKNIFLGKCWQLPFCRKFVREKCPIYHSRRTCWRERVGCMCEEEVIRNAMQNRTIPKDSLMAAKYIPNNNKITLDQKKERCRQCVIYNEHQKHKYKLILFLTLSSFVLVYAIGRKSLLGLTEGVFAKLDQILTNATYSGTGTFQNAVDRAPVPLQELLLVCFLIILMTYSLKFIEFLVFKLKV